MYKKYFFVSFLFLVIVEHSLCITKTPSPSPTQSRSLSCSRSQSKSLSANPIPSPSPSTILPGFFKVTGEYHVFDGAPNMFNQFNTIHQVLQQIQLDGIDPLSQFVTIFLHRREGNAAHLGDSNNEIRLSPGINIQGMTATGLFGLHIPVFASIIVDNPVPISSSGLFTRNSFSGIDIFCPPAKPCFHSISDTTKGFYIPIFGAVDMYRFDTTDPTSVLRIEGEQQEIIYRDGGVIKLGWEGSNIEIIDGASAALYTVFVVGGSIGIDIKGNQRTLDPFSQMFMTGLTFDGEDDFGILNNNYTGIKASVGYLGFFIMDCDFQIRQDPSVTHRMVGLQATSAMAGFTIKLVSNQIEISPDNGVSVVMDIADGVRVLGDFLVFPGSVSARENTGTIVNWDSTVPLP